VKPGDHPDFYRFAPPPGTSRESSIVLDREGRFWHEGERVEHPALEKGLRKFLKSGIEALADLQIEEDEQATPPITKMHQKFAGMNRWLLLEQVLSGGR